MNVKIDTFFSVAVLHVIYWVAASLLDKKHTPTNKRCIVKLESWLVSKLLLLFIVYDVYFIFIDIDRSETCSSESCMSRRIH